MQRILTLVISLCFVVCATSADAAKVNQSSTKGTRKSLQTIVFAGLAGAVLGLSTLSFYGRPQDKLSNIAVGFALGVITGTAYTTYMAATQPREFYGLRGPQGPQPEVWRPQQPLFASDSSPVLAQWSWQF